MVNQLSGTPVTLHNVIIIDWFREVVVRHRVNSTHLLPMHTEKQGLPSGLTPKAFRFAIVSPKAKFEALPGFLVPSGLTPKAFRFAT